jgi:hypothetical protein
MAITEDLLGVCTECMNPEYEFPGITEPGLPNLVLGSLLATLGGISFVLDFLPPDPLNLPSIPTIDLFFKPLTGAMAIDFPLPPTGDPSKIELTPPEGPGFPAVGLINIALTVVFTVFGLFIGIIESILKLSPKLPTPQLFIDLFTVTGEGFGLSVEVIGKLAGCLAKSVIGLITALIPI